ncbi:MAG TPA: hypothetical protein VK821_06770 [Dehalococcoidia bacterium]|nr:hypothetical protein [Dehalococcoidia bacterium]
MPQRGHVGPASTLLSIFLGSHVPSLGSELSVPFSTTIFPRRSVISGQPAIGRRVGVLVSRADLSGPMSDGDRQT